MQYMEAALDCIQTSARSQPQPCECRVAVYNQRWGRISGFLGGFKLLHTYQRVGDRLDVNLAGGSQVISKNLGRKNVTSFGYSKPPDIEDLLKYGHYSRGKTCTQLEMTS